MVRPWSRPLRGRIDELTIVSAALAGNPLGDPAERPLWVYLPPGYDDAPSRRYPTIYLIQGMTGQIDMWRNRSAFRPTTPENVDALFAGDGPGEGAPPPDDRRLRRLLDLVRRQPVPGLAGDRSLPHLPVRRGRPVRRRTLSDAGRARPPRDHRQVEWRLRGDDHADAPAGPVRRPGDPRRRRPVRVLLRADVRRGRPGPARSLRRIVRALVGRLPVAAGLLEAG